MAFSFASMRVRFGVGYKKNGLNLRDKQMFQRIGN